jgi:CheY-like chemotaxis protein
MDTVEYSSKRVPARLLVVDDDQLFRAVLRDTLIEKGYSVLVASDGLEAINVLAKEPVDLILLDIFMPEIDGFGVLRHVKRLMSKVKVVIVTAYTELKIVMEAKKLGANYFIYKPYMVQDLLDTIERVLRPPEKIDGWAMANKSQSS